MDAARRGFELIIVDLGRSGEGVGRLAWDCDKLLLLTTAHLRSAVASARILNELPPVETGLIVRGSNASPVSPSFIAESLGLPLVGVVPEVRGVAAGTELGRLLEMGRRKSVGRFTDEVLELNGAIQ
jgi:hypothetical protein